MYEVREVGVKFTDQSLTGYQRSVFGGDNVMEATVAKDTDPNGTSYVQLMDIWGEDVHFTCAHLPSTGELYQIGVRADNAEARKMLLQGLKFLIKGLEEEEDE